MKIFVNILIMFVVCRPIVLAQNDNSGMFKQDNAAVPDEVITLYKNIFIGEVFTSGEMYLEYFSLEREEAHCENMAELPFNKTLTVYPLQQSARDSFQAEFVDCIQNTYLPTLEGASRYFFQPYSAMPHHALHYRSEQTVEEPVTLVVAFNTAVVQQITYFSEDEKRAYSQDEYARIINDIERDRMFKKENPGPLAELTEDLTLLNARKYALIQLEDYKYDIQVSYYKTLGWEYVADVYVIDFLQNGNIVFTKEKRIWDGPY